MNEKTITAPAKINLALDIVGKFADGFHDLKMIMQSINLTDKVKIKEIPAGIKLDIPHAKLPLDEKNVAYQAAKLFLEENNLDKGVKIYIEKNIPIAAGLAGGSTDAAAVLRGMNQLFKTKMSLDDILMLARQIGSDVPFCVEGGTALATGKGDRLNYLPDLPSTQLVIVTPPLQISTPVVYNAYDELKPDIKIPVNSLVNDLKHKNTINWKAGWNNVLEAVTINMTQEVDKIKEILLDYAVDLVMMTGSGPTVFAICENDKIADEITANWPRKNDFITKAKTVGRAPLI